MSLGHFSTGNLSLMDIDSAAQFRDVLTGRGQSERSQSLHIANGDIGESLSGRPGIDSGHIVHAAVDDAFLDKHWISMSRRSGGQILLVRKRGTNPCTRLHDDLHASTCKLSDSRGGQTDAVFLTLDFARATHDEKCLIVNKYDVIKIWNSVLTLENLTIKIYRDHSLLMR